MVVVIAALATVNAHEIVIPDFLVDTPTLELAPDPAEILFLNLMILVSVDLILWDPDYLVVMTFAIDVTLMRFVAVGVIVQYYYAS